MKKNIFLKFFFIIVGAALTSLCGIFLDNTTAMNGYYWMIITFLGIIFVNLLQTLIFKTILKKNMPVKIQI